MSAFLFFFYFSTRRYTHLSSGNLRIVNAFLFLFYFSTRRYTHVPTSAGENSLDPSVISEIIYPQGRILLTKKSDRTLMVQNTAFLPVVMRKKRKRALVQVSLPHSPDQQRFFEDGSHETVTPENASSASVMCKVSITETEDGGQEVNVCFTSSTPPPAPTPAAPVEDPRKKEKEKKAKEMKEAKEKSEKVAEMDKENAEGGSGQ